MGNSSSETELSDAPDKCDFILLDYGYCTVWKRRSDLCEIMEEYTLSIESPEYLEQYKKTWLTRAKSDKFVKVLYFSHKNPSSFCGTYAEGQIFLERIEKRLSSFWMLPYSLSMHILRVCIEGFQQLYNIFGLFYIKSTMIGIKDWGYGCGFSEMNQQSQLPPISTSTSSSIKNIIKLWHHPDFSEPCPQDANCKDMFEMLISILNSVEQNAENPRNCPRFSEFLVKNNKHMISFNSLLVGLDAFVSMYGLWDGKGDGLWSDGINGQKESLIESLLNGKYLRREEGWEQFTNAHKYPRLISNSGQKGGGYQDEKPVNQQKQIIKKSHSPSNSISNTNNHNHNHNDYGLYNLEKSMIAKKNTEKTKNSSTTTRKNRLANLEPTSISETNSNNNKIKIVDTLAETIKKSSVGWFSSKSKQSKAKSMNKNSSGLSYGPIASSKLSYSSVSSLSSSTNNKTQEWKTNDRRVVNSFENRIAMEEEEKERLKQQHRHQQQQQQQQQEQEERERLTSFETRMIKIQDNHKHNNHHNRDHDHDQQYESKFKEHSNHLQLQPQPQPKVLINDYYVMNSTVDMNIHNSNNKLFCENLKFSKNAYSNVRKINHKPNNPSNNLNNNNSSQLFSPPPSSQSSSYYGVVQTNHQPISSTFSFNDNHNNKEHSSGKRGNSSSSSSSISRISRIEDMQHANNQIKYHQQHQNQHKQLLRR